MLCIHLCQESSRKVNSDGTPLVKSISKNPLVCSAFEVGQD